MSMLPSRIWLTGTLRGHLIDSPFWELNSKTQLVFNMQHMQHMQRDYSC